MSNIDESYDRYMTTVGSNTNVSASGHKKVRNSASSKANQSQRAHSSGILKTSDPNATASVIIIDDNNELVGQFSLSAAEVSKLLSPGEVNLSTDKLSEAFENLCGPFGISQSGTYDKLSFLQLIMFLSMFTTIQQEERRQTAAMAKNIYTKTCLDVARTTFNFGVDSAKHAKTAAQIEAWSNFAKQAIDVIKSGVELAIMLNMKPRMETKTMPNDEAEAVGDSTTNRQGTKTISEPSEADQMRINQTAKAVSDIIGSLLNMTLVSLSLAASNERYLGDINKAYENFSETLKNVLNSSIQGAAETGRDALNSKIKAIEDINKAITLFFQTINSVSRNI
ncbi:MAG: hypothetical protein LBI81_02405 [Puniceicoccales bacterium]|jgi:hypothetical protein|nr:hypothetical protein [Puniceicoccales bacterium]